MDDGGDSEGRRGAAVRRLLAGSALLVAAMAMLSLWAWLVTPAGAEVIVHRGIDGAPTRTGSIIPLLVGLPIVAVLLTGLLAAVVRTGGTTWWETDADAPSGDPMVHAGFGIGVVGLFAALHTAFLLDAVGVLGNAVGPVVVAMGAFALLLGGLLLAERTGEALLQVVINLPRPAHPDARRTLRRVVGTGFAATGAATFLGALVGPAWSPISVLLVGLLLTAVAGLAVALRHQ